MLAVEESAGADGEGGGVIGGRHLLPVQRAAGGTQKGRSAPCERPASGGVEHLQTEERDRAAGPSRWRRQPGMGGASTGRGSAATDTEDTEQAEERHQQETRSCAGVRRRRGA